jgi:hypothetical protein
MTTIIDGSAGITFPSGTNAQAAPSKVLQVVSTTVTTQTNTSSTSFVTTGIQASITPLFSTSKIYIVVHTNTINTTVSSNVYLTIYRNNTTNLCSSSSGAFTVYQTGSASGSPAWLPATVNYLDSPATTSATTYTLYLAVSSGGSGYTNITGTTSVITLMEVAV